MYASLTAHEERAAHAPAFLRQRNWHVWRATYLQETPADARGAWVRRAGAKEQSRIALVRDIYLGSIKLRTAHRFESGALLHIEIWDSETEHYRTFAVRVLRVVADPLSPEFLHTCAFLPATATEPTRGARCA